MKFMQNIKAAYAADSRDELDRGDIVQTILLIAGFAIVTILAVNWIGKAILNKGADVANCIEGAGTYTSTATATADNCKKTVVNGTTTFKNDAGYKSRYP